MEESEIDKKLIKLLAFKYVLQEIYHGNIREERRRILIDICKAEMRILIKQLESGMERRCPGEQD